MLKFCNRHVNDENLLNTLEANWNLIRHYFSRKRNFLIKTKIIVQTKFSLGMSNAYGVLITYLGFKPFIIKNRKI